MSANAEQEQIVFTHSDGTPTGETGPKLASHTANTKMHLAFSCYIFRPEDNKLLVTQRALSKKVWPGVWTNSVCGHPMPRETLEDAVKRRALYELDINTLDNLRCVLPNYTYKTPPYNDIVENEFCPVFVACTSQEPHANPTEVEAYQWLTWLEYTHLLKEKPEEMSYWCKDQYRLLKDLKPFITLTALGKSA